MTKHDIEGFNRSHSGVGELDDCLASGEFERKLNSSVVRPSAMTAAQQQALLLVRDYPGRTSAEYAEILGITNVRPRIANLAGMGYLSMTERMHKSNHRGAQASRYCITDTGLEAIKRFGVTVASAPRQTTTEYEKYEPPQCDRHEIRPGSMDAFKLPSLTPFGRTYPRLHQ